MSPDIFAVHQAQLVRRQALSPVERAYAIERYRRPTSWLSRLFLAVAAVLLLAAFVGMK